MILGYTLFRAGLVGGLGIAAVHHFAWKGLALVLFVMFSFRLPLVAMLLMGAILYAAMFALRWQQTRAMMRAFMATAIADWFENDPSRMQRKIEEREVTVLFADIRGFSLFSDGRNPREVARLLMEYFDVVVPTIEEHGGALNQYMGDGMMVLFGATDDQPDHAARGLRAGVALVRAIRGHAKKWAELGMPGLRIGVGINTGQTVVGAISAQNLMDFTAIGDTTNAAARIESLNKEQGTEILISDKTFNQVSMEELARLGCESQGRVIQVRGKKEPLTVHAVNVLQGEDGGPEPRHEVSGQGLPLTPLRCVRGSDRTRASDLEQRPRVLLEHLRVVDLRDGRRHPGAVDRQRRQRPVAAVQEAVGPLRVAERPPQVRQQLLQRLAPLGAANASASPTASPDRSAQTLTFL